MSYMLAEPLAVAVRAWLVGSLPAILHDIEGQFDPYLQLHIPEAIHLSEQSFTASTARRCDMAVVVDRVALPQAGYQQGGPIHPLFGFRILVYVVDADAERRKRLVYRYHAAVVRAVDAAMADHGNLDSYALVGAALIHETTFTEDFGIGASTATISLTAEKQESSTW